MLPWSRYHLVPLLFVRALTDVSNTHLQHPGLLVSLLHSARVMLILWQKMGFRKLVGIYFYVLLQGYLLIILLILVACKASDDIFLNLI